MCEIVTKFCIVIKVDKRKILRGRPRPLHWPIFVTQMLTRGLFAVANLLALFCAKHDRKQINVLNERDFVE